MFIQPERWLEEHQVPRRARLSVEVPLFFAIGIYGGFLQAGVGIFLIAALVLSAGFNLVTANAVKNLMVLVFTAAALVVFIVHDQVDWTLGLSARGRPVARRVARGAHGREARREVRALGRDRGDRISAAALLGGIG